MAEVISCCGIVCSACDGLNNDCAGCLSCGGKAPWLNFVSEEVCHIYECCRTNKQLDNCGQCGEAPCELWREYDSPFESDQPVFQARDEGRLVVLKKLRL